MLIYLAGAISIHDRNDEYHKATDWRKNAGSHLRLLGYEIFNPTVNFHVNLSSVSSESVVAQNKLYLKNSDLMLVNIADLKESPGTIWEIYMAKEWEIPVIAFGESGLAWSPHISTSLTEEFDTMGNAINHITNMYHLKI